MLRYFIILICIYASFSYDFTESNHLSGLNVHNDRKHNAESKIVQLDVDGFMSSDDDDPRAYEPSDFNSKLNRRIQKEYNYESPINEFDRKEIADYSNLKEVNNGQTFNALKDDGPLNEQNSDEGEKDNKISAAERREAEYILVERYAFQDPEKKRITKQHKRRQLQCSYCGHPYINDPDSQAKEKVNQLILRSHSKRAYENLCPDCVRKFIERFYKKQSINPPDKINHSKKLNKQTTDQTHNSKELDPVTSDQIYKIRDFDPVTELNSKKKFTVTSDQIHNYKVFDDITSEHIINSEHFDLVTSDQILNSREFDTVTEQILNSVHINTKTSEQVQNNKEFDEVTSDQILNSEEFGLVTTSPKYKNKDFDPKTPIKINNGKEFDLFTPNQILSDKEFDLVIPDSIHVSKGFGLETSGQILNTEEFDLATTDQTQYKKHYDTFMGNPFSRGKEVERKGNNYNFNEYTADHKIVQDKIREKQIKQLAEIEMKLNTMKVPTPKIRGGLMVISKL